MRAHLAIWEIVGAMVLVVANQESGSCSNCAVQSLFSRTSTIDNALKAAVGGFWTLT